MSTWLLIAAINGFLAVAAGAFAAHGLHGRLDTHAMQIFETAARYQMYHALAIGLASFAMRNAARLMAVFSAAAFLAGIVLFSGSLYVLAVTDAHALAFITPLGGAAFMIGWIALGGAAIRLGTAFEI